MTRFHVLGRCVRGAQSWVAVALVILFLVGLAAGYYAALYTRPAATVTQSTTVTVTGYRTVTRTVTHTVTVTRGKPYYPVTLVDALGRVVTIAKPPRRIVSLAPSITEIIFSLGRGGLLVGVDSSSNYPPTLLRLEKEGRVRVVGSYWSPDVEKIAALKPDIVFASAAVPSHRGLGRKLESMGITVVYLKAGGCRDLSDVLHDMYIVARALDAYKAYFSLALNITRTIGAVEARLAEAHVKPVRVMVLLSPPQYGLWVAGGGTFIDYVVSHAGAVNVFHGLNGWVKVSKEQVLSAKPEAIILATMATPQQARKLLEELLSNPVLSATPAVKTGRVYVLTGEADDILCRPGPRIALAVEMVASLLHPGVVKAPPVKGIYSAALVEARG